MSRFFVLIAFLAYAAHAADHTVFKDCSNVPFCSSLRNRKMDDISRFVPDVPNYRVENDIVSIPMSNSKGDILYLQISLYGDGTSRVKIVEENHTRYELEDVLKDDLPLKPLDYFRYQTRVLYIFGRGEDYLNGQLVVVVEGPPFLIYFHLDSENQVIFYGERFFMDNTNGNQAFTFEIEHGEVSKLYGLYHHASKIALEETIGSADPFRLRNSDVDNYEVDSRMGLYASIPVIYGHSVDSTSGIFLHNAAEQWVDISYRNTRPTTYFMVESGTLDLFVMLGPTPKDVVRQYTSLTGTAHMPQIWTLGYHQSRFSYATQEDAKEVIAQMDKHDFPMDAIWLDVGHSNGGRYFEWNPKNFSDPIEMLHNISSTGRKVVSISDPHIKVDDDYTVYAEAKTKYFVRWANGSDFEGISWPGLSSYVDFLNPAAREYYAGWYAYDKFNGSTETLAGIWNDMNEPSVFDDATERTLPFDTLHFGNVPHRDVHNIYGFLQTKATHHGLMQRDNGTKRPFILTRSHFAGSQRYAATWTGDNTADWSYLASSYSECITANLLGMVFCGADIGGTLGNPNDELLQRWYQAAVWLPFYRGHSNIDTPRREPYSFPEDVQSVIRAAIKLRYKHIPVFYTLFYEHTLYGDPIVRPLFYHYPEYLEYDDHILVGSDILARPVTEPNVKEVEVTFPGSRTNYWYRVDDGSWRKYVGGSVEKIPVNITTSPLFYRGGSIIARLDVERSSTAQMLKDPYTLYVNPDENNFAEGRLYIDDYTSFNYRDKESYLYLQFVYIPESHGVEISKIDGNSNGFNGFIKEIVVQGSSAIGFKSTSHTTIKDGTPLASVDVMKHLSMQNDGLILHL